MKMPLDFEYKICFLRDMYQVRDRSGMVARGGGIHLNRDESRILAHRGDQQVSMEC